jgi:hypothetical protein
MPQFRKKPVVIDAYQIPAHEHTAAIPAWVIQAVIDKQIVPDPSGGVSIPTLEGTMRGEVGDWIIKGVKGEFYPCKPDIFEATYDAVDQPTGTPV